LVDEFIAPAIEYLANFMKLSESLAGVTLIALANGAGDVVTAIVASGSADGVAYNVGALFGAGLFVCTFVIAFTILSSSNIPIIVDKNTIYRDMPYYIIATVFVIICGAIGHLNVWTSCIMLAIYIALVFTVYIQDNIKDNKKEQSKEPLLESSEVEVEEENDRGNVIIDSEE